MKGSKKIGLKLVPIITILDFDFLLSRDGSWHNFNFGLTFFVNCQIVCSYPENEYRINIRNSSLSGLLATYFLTLFKKDPVYNKWHS